MLMSSACNASQSASGHILACTSHLTFALVLVFVVCALPASQLSQLPLGDGAIHPHAHPHVAITMIDMHTYTTCIYICTCMHRRIDKADLTRPDLTAISAVVVV